MEIIQSHQYLSERSKYFTFFFIIFSKETTLMLTPQLTVTATLNIVRYQDFEMVLKVWDGNQTQFELLPKFINHNTHTFMK